MKTDSTSSRRSLSVINRCSLVRVSILLQSFALLALLACSSAPGQTNNAAKRQKLPSPEKIVGDYLKAIGGKRRVAAIKDATYEWTVVKDDPMFLGLRTGTTQLKPPASTHFLVESKAQQGTADGIRTGDHVSKDLLRFESGANARSAWIRDDATGLRTLTDARAQTAKLYSMLDASHLVDYKKSRVLARTTGLDESTGEPAYVVEFSLRNGARVRYWFSVSNKLLRATDTDVHNMSRTFSDYKDENGLLEPHKVSWHTRETEILTLQLKQVRYNTGLSDSLFDPPSTEPIDIGAMLRDVDHNQEIIDERVGEYTYTEKRTERKINDKGEVTEETVGLFEVYPVPGRESVRKLISENGVPLSAEKAAKEEKRVSEALEKAERERVKAVEKRRKDTLGGNKRRSDRDDVGIADFLSAAEMVSPRRERLRDRDAIVFDFRPRAGYKPKTSVESIITKLAGVVWIDPVDNQVMRLEARLIESYKMGGGLLASVRPGTAVVFEQKRMDDGVWLPVFSQANISAKIFLFKGINVNVVQEFSNYQRFKSNVDDYKLTSPDQKSKAPPSP